MERAFRDYLDRTLILSRGCPEEDDWSEMFQVLGNRTEQEIIRRMNPTGKHCDLLQVSANACEGCKNNPQARATGRGSTDDFYAGMVSRGFDLALDRELGVLTDPLQLSPIEYRALKIARGVLEDMKYGRLALMLGRLFAGGGGKDAGS